jgi:hypothetical protein
MRKTSILATVIAALALLVQITLAGAQQAQPASPGQQPIGTAFTYQGRLDDGDRPANGTYDFSFALFATAEGGEALTAPIVVEDLAVQRGIFMTSLDFGAAPFAGSAPYLAIQVRPGASSADFTALTPRQPLTPAPLAIYATAAGSAQQVPWSGVSDVPAGLKQLGGLNCADGEAPTWGAPGWQCGSSVMARPGMIRSTIDSQGEVGKNSSVIIGSDGLGLISYSGYGSADLKVAHCNDLACSSATVSTLDSAEVVGAYTSVTIGRDGLGLISYFDIGNSDLKVAHCNDLACSSASLAAVDSAANVGGGTSIVIGSDGLGLISYHDDGNSDLKVAHCNDLACSSASAFTLDSAGVVGYYTSLSIGSDGLGLISYWDQSLGDLKVAHCNNLACSSAQLSAHDPGLTSTGRWSSLTIGTDGLGLISYFTEVSDDLNVAHCNNLACSTATISTLDSAGSVGQKTAITLGADGLGLITYYDASNTNVKAAHCNNLACTSASTTVVDDEGIVGSDISVTIGSDGLPLVSYFDGSNGDLKVTHCANPFCTPYVRRR